MVSNLLAIKGKQQIFKLELKLLLQMVLKNLYNQKAINYWAAVVHSALIAETIDLIYSLFYFNLIVFTI